MKMNPDNVAAWKESMTNAVMELQAELIGLSNRRAAIDLAIEEIKSTGHTLMTTLDEISEDTTLVDQAFDAFQIEPRGVKISYARQKPPPLEDPRPIVTSQIKPRKVSISRRKPHPLDPRPIVTSKNGFGTILPTVRAWILENWQPGVPFSIEDIAKGLPVRMGAQNSLASAMQRLRKVGVVSSVGRRQWIVVG